MGAESLRGGVSEETDEDEDDKDDDVEEEAEEEEPLLESLRGAFVEAVSAAGAESSPGAWGCSFSISSLSIS